jgi:hypothetical protein
LVWRVEMVRDNQILEICLKKLVELLRQKELDEANHSPLAHRRNVFAHASRAHIRSSDGGSPLTSAKTSAD